MTRKLIISNLTTSKEDELADQYSDYCPMFYDVMRDGVNRLVGELVYAAWRAPDPASRAALLADIVDARREAFEVNARRWDDVLTATWQFTKLANRLRDDRLISSMGTDLGEYTVLTNRQMRTVFEQLIVPTCPVVSGENPTLTMVGGQPGAGKTRVIRVLMGTRRDVTEVSGDDLRAYHPDYARMLEESPKSMPDLTRDASGAWVRMELDYLRERHANVVVETTFAHPEANARTLRMFRDAGYYIRMVVCAVPVTLSAVRISERYEFQVQDYGTGRLTDSDYHDHVVDVLPRNVAALIRSGLPDDVLFIDQTGTPLLESSVGATNRESLAERAASVIANTLSIISRH